MNHGHGGVFTLFHREGFLWAGLTVVAMTIFVYRSAFSSHRTYLIPKTRHPLHQSISTHLCLRLPFYLPENLLVGKTHAALNRAWDGWSPFQLSAFRNGILIANLV